MIVHGPYPMGEPRVAREARAALRDGFEVDVIALRREGEPAVEEVEGIRVVRLPISHRRGAGIAGVVVEYLGFLALATVAVARLALRRRYQVVQVHSPPDFLIAAALVPKLLGARVILDVHDLSSDMFLMRFAGRRWAELAGPVLRLLEAWAARLADAVVTVHEPYRRELVGRGVPAEKLTVVMNSLDEALLPTTDENEGRSAFRVVYHGTVTPPYGVELLIEAAARLVPHVPALRVEIYGEGDSVPAVRRRAEELDIGDRVLVTGRYLPHREVLERIRGASVGVVPNLPTALNRFALSSKLLEYVAMGIPVVCADLPTLRAHFSPDEVLFFRAGDSDSLAEALSLVLHHPEETIARAAAARCRYGRYRWEVQADRYVSLLHALA